MVSASRNVPAGFNRKEGACNASIPDDVFQGFLYCHRPDNGTGMCNVHQAAKARGEARRKANWARREAEGWRPRRRF